MDIGSLRASLGVDSRGLDDVQNRLTQFGKVADQVFSQASQAAANMAKAASASGQQIKLTGAASSVKEYSTKVTEATVNLKMLKVAADNVFGSMKSGASAVRNAAGQFTAFSKASQMFGTSGAMVTKQIDGTVMKAREYAKSIDSQLKQNVQGVQSYNVAIGAQLKTTSSLFESTGSSVIKQIDKISRSINLSSATIKKRVPATAMTNSAAPEQLALFNTSIIRAGYTNNFEKLRDAITQTTAAIPPVSKQLSLFTSESYKNAAGLAKVVTQANKAKAEVASFNNTMKSSGGGAGGGGTRNVAGEFGKRSTFDWIKGVAAGMLAYRGIMVVMQGLSEAFIGPIREAIKFEDQMANVAKVLGPTDKSLGYLSQRFRELAETIPLPLQDIIEIGKTAAQLGIASQDIASFTKTIANLAATTDNLTAEAASMSLAKFINITGMGMNDIDKLGSSILMLGNNMATTEKDMVNMAMRVAAAGTKIGLTSGEIMAFAGALSSVGVRAEMGGTAISRVFTKIDKEIATNGKHLALWSKTAGMSVDKFKDAFRTDTVNTLKAIFSNMGDVAKESGKLTVLLDQLGIKEQRAIDTVTRLALGHDKLNQAFKLNEKGWNNEAYLAEQAAKRNDTLAKKWTLFISAIRNSAIDIGNLVTPALKNMIVVLTDSVKWLSGVSEASNLFRQSIVVLGTTLAASSIVNWLMALQSTPKILIALETGFKSLRIAISMLVAGEFSNLFTALTGTASLAGVATKALSGFALVVGRVGQALIILEGIKISKWVKEYLNDQQKLGGGIKDIRAQNEKLRKELEAWGVNVPVPPLIDITKTLTDPSEIRNAIDYHDELLGLIKFYAPTLSKNADANNAFKLSLQGMGEEEKKLAEELYEHAHAADLVAENMEKMQKTGQFSDREIMSAWGEDLINKYQKQLALTGDIDDNTTEWINKVRAFLADVARTSPTPEMLDWMKDFRDFKISDSFFEGTNQLVGDLAEVQNKLNNVKQIASDLSLPKEMRDWAERTATTLEAEIAKRSKMIDLMYTYGDQINYTTQLSANELFTLYDTEKKRKAISESIKENGKLLKDNLDVELESRDTIEKIRQTWDQFSAPKGTTIDKMAAQETEKWIAALKEYYSISRAISKSVLRDNVEQLRYQEKILDTMVPMNSIEERRMELQRASLQMQLDKEEVLLKYVQKREELEERIAMFKVDKGKESLVLQLQTELQELPKAMQDELNQIAALNVNKIAQMHKQEYIKIIDGVRSAANTIWNDVVLGGQDAFSNLLDWIKNQFISRLGKLFENVMAEAFTGFSGGTAGLLDGVIPGIKLAMTQAAEDIAIETATAAKITTAQEVANDTMNMAGIPEAYAYEFGFPAAQQAASKAGSSSIAGVLGGLGEGLLSSLAMGLPGISAGLIGSNNSYLKGAGIVGLGATGLAAGSTLALGGGMSLFSTILASAIPIIGAVVATVLSGIALYKWAKGKSTEEAGAMEVSRDLGGIKYSKKAFKEFYESVGLTQGEAWGIRQNLKMSPKFLKEQGWEAAQAQGKEEEFKTALQHVGTSWAGETDMRAEFEIGRLTDDWTMLDDAYRDLFGNMNGLTDKLMITDALEEWEQGVVDLNNFKNQIEDSIIPATKMYDTFLETGKITDEFKQQIHDLGGELATFEEYSGLIDLQTTFSKLVETFRETGEIVPELKQIMLDYGASLTAIDAAADIPNLKKSLDFIDSLSSGLDSLYAEYSPVNQFLAGNMTEEVINAMKDAGLDPTKLSSIADMIGAESNWDSYEPFNTLTPDLEKALMTYGGSQGQTAVKNYYEGFNTITQDLLDATKEAMDVSYKNELKTAIDYLKTASESTSDRIEELTAIVEDQITLVSDNITSAIDVAKKAIVEQLKNMMLILAQQSYKETTTNTGITTPDLINNGLLDQTTWTNTAAEIMNQYPNEETGTKAVLDYGTQLYQEYTNWVGEILNSLPDYVKLTAGAVLSVFPSYIPHAATGGLVRVHDEEAILDTSQTRNLLRGNGRNGSSVVFNNPTIFGWKDLTRMMNDADVEMSNRGRRIM
jgi:TP901 family phage tail tape measure protein